MIVSSSSPELSASMGRPLLTPMNSGTSVDGPRGSRPFFRRALTPPTLNLPNILPSTPGVRGLVPVPFNIPRLLTPSSGYNFRGKHIGWWGGVSIIVNTTVGAGLAAVPLVFVQGGWFLPTLTTVIFGLLAGLASSWICECIRFVPGNEYFHSKVEFLTCVQNYVPSRWFALVATVGLFGALQTLNVVSIVTTAQSIDDFISELRGRNCGVELTGVNCIFHEDAALQPNVNSPFENLAITEGFVICLLLAVPLALVNLEENVGFQIATFLFCIVTFALWIIDLVFWEGERIADANYNPVDTGGGVPNISSGHVFFHHYDLQHNHLHDGVGSGGNQTLANIIIPAGATASREGASISPASGAAAPNNPNAVEEIVKHEPPLGGIVPWRSTDVVPSFANNSLPTILAEASSSSAIVSSAVTAGMGLLQPSSSRGHRLPDPVPETKGNSTVTTSTSGTTTPEPPVSPLGPEKAAIKTLARNDGPRGGEAEPWSTSSNSSSKNASSNSAASPAQTHESSSVGTQQQQQVASSSSNAPPPAESSSSGTRTRASASTAASDHGANPAAGTASPDARASTQPKSGHVARYLFSDFFGDGIYSQLMGTVMSNFAVAIIVPSWLNEKEPSVSVNETIWFSMGICVAIYLVVGLLGAAYFGHLLTEEANFLSVMIHRSASFPVRFTCYAYPVVASLTGVPLCSIVCRYNLLEQQLCTTERSANFWAILVPWMFAIPLQTLNHGNLAEGFLTSGSLLFSTWINFVVPFYVFLEYNDVYLEQPSLLSRLTSSSTSWLSERANRVAAMRSPVYRNISNAARGLSWPGEIVTSGSGTSNENVLVGAAGIGGGFENGANAINPSPNLLRAGGADVGESLSPLSQGSIIVTGSGQQLAPGGSSSSASLLSENGARVDQIAVLLGSPATAAPLAGIAEEVNLGSYRPLLPEEADAWQPNTDTEDEEGAAAGGLNSFSRASSKDSVSSADKKDRHYYSNRPAAAANSSEAKTTNTADRFEVVPHPLDAAKSGSSSADTEDIVAFRIGSQEHALGKWLKPGSTGSKGDLDALLKEDEKSAQEDAQPQTTSPAKTNSTSSRRGTAAVLPALVVTDADHDDEEASGRAPAIAPAGVDAVSNVLTGAGPAPVSTLLTASTRALKDRSSRAHWGVALKLLGRDKVQWLAFAALLFTTAMWIVSCIDQFQEGS